MERPEPDLQARLAKISLVLMDIDGTLVSSDRATFDNVVHQLRKLKRLNIRFTVATGRTVGGSADVLAGLRDVGMRMPPIIHYNGGVVLSGPDSGIVSRHVVPPDLFRAAIELCRRRGLTPVAYACRGDIARAPVEQVYAERDAPAAEFNGMPIVRVHDLAAVDDDIVAVLVETPDPQTAVELAAALAAEAGDRLRISTSGGHHVEICHPLGTKRGAMEIVARHHGVGLGEIMAIGDNLNDLEMIQAAGVGVAVANAPTPVKASADYVCTRPSAEGVVEAIRLLVSVIRREPTLGISTDPCRTRSRTAKEPSGRRWARAS